MIGFFNINKPTGPTSHDIVARVRKLLGRGIKVGHAGTLDPFANGVLVMCVGPATRLAEYVQRQHKRYIAEVRLGATSTTDDPEGEITETPNAEPPSEEELSSVLGRFDGRIEQVPPAHSAVHVGGRRAYKLARAGKQPPLQARQVTIERIEILEYDYPRLRLDVTCGTGTYIRSLARDIGAALKVGGYCSKLTRTEVGPFRLPAAVSIEALDPRRDLLDPLAALEGLSRVAADEVQAERLANGNPIKLAGEHPPGYAAIVDKRGHLIAIGTIAGDGRTVQPTKVLPSSQGAS